VRRPQQPDRVRLVASRDPSRDAFFERRRNRRLADEDYLDDVIEMAPPVAVKATSHAGIYWAYVTLFILFCAMGGFVIAAMGLFEEVGR